MAFRYSPKIVTDGLVLSLDAANKKSYPGSGTVWTDLSGNGNNGTLVNGPTFDSNNGGSIDFDGTNDYVDCGEYDIITTSLTFEVWVKPIGINFNSILTGGPSTDGLSPAYENGFYFGYDSRDTQNHLYLVIFGNTRQPIDESFDLIENQYYQITVSSSNTTVKFFINGNEFTSTNSNPVPMTSTTLQHLIIGGRLYKGISYVNSNVSSVKIYNRALSAEEVLQNYNATKGRFGL